MSRKIQKLGVLLAGLSLMVFGCQEQMPPWTDKDIVKNLTVMENAGTAFAVHDVCMSMIVFDDDARNRVAGEIEAKRFAELLNYDTAAEYDHLVAYFEKSGGTEDQVLALKEAHQSSYDEAVEEIKTLQQCEDTVIDFHNTILNTGVRTLN